MKVGFNDHRAEPLLLNCNLNKSQNAPFYVLFFFTGTTPTHPYMGVCLNDPRVTLSILKLLDPPLVSSADVRLCVTVNNHVILDCSFFIVTALFMSDTEHLNDIKEV